MAEAEAGEKQSMASEVGWFWKIAFPVPFIVAALFSTFVLFRRQPAGHMAIWYAALSWITAAAWIWIWFHKRPVRNTPSPTVLNLNRD